MLVHKPSLIKKEGEKNKHVLWVAENWKQWNTTSKSFLHLGRLYASPQYVMSNEKAS